MNLQRILLAIAISSGLTLATVSHAQNWHSRHMRTPTSAPADTTAPTTPTGLAASAPTSSSLTLSWNASTDDVGVTGYRVYRGGMLVASPSGTSVSITGLSAGVPYSLTVSAFDAAGNVSALSAPLSVTLQQILWSAGMEMGNLSEWSEKTNTAYADSLAVTAASVGIPPHGGNYVLKQVITSTVLSGEGSGTRMQRYPEITSLAAAGTSFYVSWWDYYPTPVIIGSNDMYSTFQICSKDSAGVPQPIWGLFFQPTGNTLVLGWSPAGTAPAEGPHAGESGKRAYYSTTPVPVGQWVFFEVMITPKADFTGEIKLSMNGQVLFDQTAVKLRFPDSALGGWMYVQHTAYGGHLTPTPYSHYVDDVTISLGRMPYP